jgi:hypothetical protein
VAPERISFARDTYRFEFAGSPAAFVDTFRSYYGPTMNAFAAAETQGRGGDLEAELEALFAEQNVSTNPQATSIAATFLRVTAAI